MSHSLLKLRWHETLPSFVVKPGRYEDPFLGLEIFMKLVKKHHLLAIQLKAIVQHLGQ